jgi:hypothetical protein
MARDISGTAVELDVGFTVSPSGGGLGLVVAEEEHRAWVTLLGYIPSLEASQRAEGAALITFTGVMQAVFGYPNEEAFWKDPRELGHGLFEISGSTWASDLRRYNQLTFGSDLPGAAELRHLFVGSKDSSAQFLCRGFEVERFEDTRWRDVHAESVRRLHER